MKRLLFFALCALHVFSSANAADLYKCQMNKFIYLQDDEVSDGDLSDFSFEVRGDELVFGQGGYFNDSKLPIRYNNSNGWIEASEDTDVFVLADGRFHHTLVTPINVRSASGVCAESENKDD